MALGEGAWAATRRAESTPGCLTSCRGRAEVPTAAWEGRGQRGRQVLAEAESPEERSEGPTPWASVGARHICSARRDTPVPRGAVFESHTLVLCPSSSEGTVGPKRPTSVGSARGIGQELSLLRLQSDRQ